jgi:hypothetical protein
MGAASQNLANISAYGSNIGPAAAAHIESDIRQADVHNFQLVYRNRPGRLLYDGPLPSQLVKWDPAVFQGRVCGGILVSHTQEPLESLTHIVARHCQIRFLGNNATGKILGVGSNAKPHNSFVSFLSVHKKLSKSRRLVDAAE